MGFWHLPEFLQFLLQLSCCHRHLQQLCYHQHQHSMNVQFFLHIHLPIHQLGLLIDQFLFLHYLINQKPRKTCVLRGFLYIYLLFDFPNYGVAVFIIVPVKPFGIGWLFLAIKIYGHLPAVIYKKLFS